MICYGITGEGEDVQRGDDYAVKQFRLSLEIIIA